MEQVQQIRFFDKNALFFEFSNFYTKSPFVLDGKKWSSSEHYYQAAKWEHEPDYQALIIECDIPLKAFKMSKQRKLVSYHVNLVINKKTNKMKVNDAITLHKNLKPRSDWQEIKINVMRKALKAKFEQNPKLKALLKSTGNSEIIEGSPYDYFWGEGKEKTGKNVLGKLLMELRNIL